MARADVNRFGEMEAFVRVVDRGGFSTAARSLGMTPSAMSKLVARLESRLGATLVQRSTRKLSLTAEGRTFYERSLRILLDVEEAERAAGADLVPRGRVSINTSYAIGHHVLLPLVARLAELHPDIALDITLTDRVVDLVEESTDIAIRWGKLASPSLVARRLGDTEQVVAASPAYLARCGTPRTVADLERHVRIGWTLRRQETGWPFLVHGKRVTVAVGSGPRVSDGETLRGLALEGVGLARLSLFHVAADLASGRLVRVLDRFDTHEKYPIHAVYSGRAAQLPTRIRAVLDFLQTHVRLQTSAS